VMERFHCVAAREFCDASRSAAARWVDLVQTRWWTVDRRGGRACLCEYTLAARRELSCATRNLNAAASKRRTAALSPMQSAPDDDRHLRVRQHTARDAA
jgi:hypothetical protein